jgi:hypothetical protein
MILLDFIENNDNWEELLYEKCVQVKYKDNLAIFNYNLNLGIEQGKEIDFTDPIVKVCRGIIVNLDNMDVVCFPFNKFGNYTEYYADDIDWKTARVQENRLRPCVRDTSGLVRCRVSSLWAGLQGAGAQEHGGHHRLALSR